MKLIHNSSRRILLLALVLTFANAVYSLRPDLFQPTYISMLNLLGCMVLVLESLVMCRRVGVKRRENDDAKPAPDARPLASRDERARHELAAFLGLLQDKGRLVDFLMEDITDQPDARVGQVARVVHQGCAEVLHKHFHLAPVAAEDEGATLTLDKDRPARAYRLVGTAHGDGPRKGTLLHPGWQTDSITLPELTGDLPESTDAYLVSPAELELKS